MNSSDNNSQSEIGTPTLGVLLTARMKSTRLPGKAMLKIGEKTIIEHIFYSLSKIKGISHPVLCTTKNEEDDLLEQVARKNGFECFRGDEQNVMLRLLEAAEKWEIDHFLRATGDNPLIYIPFTEIAFKHHLENNRDYTSTREMPVGTKSEIIATTALKEAYDSLDDYSKTEYLTYFLDDPEKFKTAHLSVDPAIKRPDYRLTVDTEEDLKLLRELFNLLGESKFYSLPRVIELLDKSQDLRSINSHIKKKLTKEEVL